MSSPLKSWLKDIPDEPSAPVAKSATKATAIPKAANLDQLVAFIERKRMGNSKKEEALKRLRVAALKAYQRVKESA